MRVSQSNIPSFNSPNQSHTASHYAAALTLAVVLTGVAAGLGAAALTWLIHAIENISFGHSEATFRIVTDQTTPMRRLLAMTVGGTVVALGWWWLQTRGRSVVDVPGAVAADTPARKHPPLAEGVAHAVLQIIAVGSGAPVGREVAPRELGALFAGRIADALRIDDDTRRVLVACGAAAGLARVYHVPFAGVVFALEILLGVFTVRHAAIALAVSAIAVLTARIGVSSETFYWVGQLSGDTTTVLWAGFLGLLIGPFAAVFARAVEAAEQKRCQRQQVLWAIPLALLLSGVVAIGLPQVLGNGRSAAQSAYNISMGQGLQLPWLVQGLSPLMICAALLVAKVGVVLLTLRSGVFGGTLTPALSIGALLGLLLGLLAQQFAPDGAFQPSLVASTLAGSAAFLAVSMNAPLTALALVISFTGQELPAYLPLCMAVAMGMGSGLWMQRHLTLPGL